MRINKKEAKYIHKRLRRFDSVAENPTRIFKDFSEYHESISEGYFGSLHNLKDWRSYLQEINKRHKSAIHKLYDR